MKVATLTPTSVNWRSSYCWCNTIISRLVVIFNLNFIKRGDERMIEPWMGEIVSELHMKRITQNEIAEEIGVSYQYVSMVLSGKKHSPTMQGRIRDAICRIDERRSKDQVGEALCQD